jgi:hypothetical protein
MGYFFITHPAVFTHVMEKFKKESADQEQIVIFLQNFCTKAKQYVSYHHGL